MGCSHKPNADDRAAGYDCCMFCLECGECKGGGGLCKEHRVVWEVWKDRMADARNSVF